MSVNTSTLATGIIIVLLTFIGCSSGPPVVPEEFQSQIDPSLSFRDIQATPQSFQGRTVLLGGEILSAKRTQEGTEFEILQLPVTVDDPPTERRTESQGRFLALDRQGEDPASFPPGTRVTLVGEVKGQETRRLDESNYQYPTVDVKHLYVWEPDTYREHPRSSVGLFGGMGFGFGGGRSGSFGGVGIGTGF
ncbi:MAG TPA: Slp family lipoprotein [Nitrospira sp.]|nr:Slp family lipoprotein [Nitrospira sp.]